MIELNLDYDIASDIEFLMGAEHANSTDFARDVGISRTTLDGVMKRGSARNDVYEKIYSFAYGRKYRMNAVKEELLKEKYQTVLFHGSKSGIASVRDRKSVV